MQIEHRQQELEHFCRSFLQGGSTSQTDGYNEERKDRLLLALKKDSKLERLFDGYIEDYPSQSEADMALLCKLAYWFDHNPADIEWAARESQLKRDKWDRRDGEYGTYLKRSIFKTLSLADKPDNSDKSDKQDGTRQNQTESDRTRQTGQAQGQRYDGNLTGDVKEWVENSSGYFNVRDIYTDLGITHRQDRQNVSGALKDLVNKNHIHRDKQKNGVYHKLETKLNFIDVTAPCESQFPIKLPLGLSHLVKILFKGIIVLAGTSNSGKTTFALNLLWLNFIQKYPLLYLMSEMGKQEYQERLEAFSGPIEQWQRVKAASLSFGFNGSIAHHNPDGLSVVDFLEEVEGEYFKIASNIRSIYDALGDGVALICLQKKTDNPFGRGGEATAEKARLYLTMDKLFEYDGGVITVLKIVKAKSYVDKNPNGKERHIRIPRGGAEMIPLSDWMYCDQTKRDKLVEQYRRQYLTLP